MINQVLNMDIDKQILFLESLEKKIAKTPSVVARVQFLSGIANVQSFLDQNPFLKNYLLKADLQSQNVLLSIAALDQGPVVFRGLNDVDNPKKSLDQLMSSLMPVEKNYAALGGIIGYHFRVLQLIQEHAKEACSSSAKYSYSKPEGLDISQDTALVRKYIRHGIESLPLMAEIYPVGGAGDRLGLVDKETGTPLPAAKLNFCGRSLLEGLFRDLQAREYLYYQLTGKQIITPVALMTSYEKNNHDHIMQLCETSRWFDRPRDSVRCFIQPLVPTVTIEGNWCMAGPLCLRMKPGGHGVLWKLAVEAGIFDWFQSSQRQKILVRQINNPIAGIDYGLLALIGYGCIENKAFGFASCPRLLNAHEGMNVVAKQEDNEGYHYSLTNLEYTDFAKRGIKDIPEHPGSPYSALPSNTNLLFADIKTMTHLADKYPIPGLLINLKSKLPYIDPQGNVVEIAAGRLEATMQNIADYIVDTYPRPLSPGGFSKLKSFLTYNLRRKTLSVTKILYETGKELLGTPEGCLFELLENYVDLLKNYCGFDLPDLGSTENYLKKGPPFFVLLHPALGPLFSIIAQKIQGGKLSKNSELQLEIADIEIKQLHLQGSLRIACKAPLGRYGQGTHGQGTQCILKQVSVINKGIDTSHPQQFWSNHIKRMEETYIYLEENSEFIAENLTFYGAQKIIVPANKRMIAYQDQGQIRYTVEPAANIPKFWHYSFDSDNKIMLSHHGK